MEIIKGDLLKLAAEGTARIIVQGCNCFHMMGAGIAGALAQQFPEVAEADFTTVKGDPSKLGSYSLATVTQERIYTMQPYDRPLAQPFQCINLYTQYAPGADFMASIFPYAMRKLNLDFKGETLWFPLIGCGIGGGDVGFVISTMLNELKDVHIKVVVL